LVLLGPRGAFTEPRRPSDVPYVTRRHARSALLADRCAVRRTLLADGATDDFPASQRTLLRITGEGNTGNSPRTPSVVSRTCEPKPTSRTSAYFLSSALFRAPFRLLSARAPRQAVLGASFRLAPWRATRPCDLPADKTRDASDQLLPPVRSACTRTSLVPGSLRGFRHVDVSRSLGSARHDRGTRCFTTPETALADRMQTRACCAPFSLRRCYALGLRAWAFSSHGARFDRASDTSVASSSCVE